MKNIETHFHPRFLIVCHVSCNADTADYNFEHQGEMNVSWSKLNAVNFADIECGKWKSLHLHINFSSIH